MYLLKKVINTGSIIFILISLFPHSTFGQIYGQGEQSWSDEEGSALQFLTLTKPPQCKNIDLSPRLPPPRFQGKDKQSCWAFATAYAMRSFMDGKFNYLNRDGSLNTESVYSPEYAYQHYKGQFVPSCNFTAFSFKMLDSIIKNGVVRESLLPYEVNCDVSYKSELERVACNSALKDYAIEKTIDLNTILSLLCSGQPLIVAIKIDQNFIKLDKNNPYWTTYHGQGNYHAMVVVGFDSSLQAIKVLNSWGTEFGDKGYAWISYSIFEAAMAYCCYPKKIQKTAHTLSSKNINSPIYIPESSSSDPLKQNLPEMYFAEGYFIPVDGFQLINAKILDDRKTVHIEVRNSAYDLLSEFDIEVESSKTFYLADQKYRITLTRIGKRHRFGQTVAWFSLEEIN